MQANSKLNRSTLNSCRRCPLLLNALHGVFLQAGLASPADPDQLLIALEPEAASFYCRTLQMKDFLGESGDQLVNEDLASYIVIDNGGLLLNVIISSISVNSTHFVRLCGNRTRLSLGLL